MYINLLDKLGIVSGKCNGKYIVERLSDKPLLLSGKEIMDLDEKGLLKVLNLKYSLSAKRFYSHTVTRENKREINLGKLNSIIPQNVLENCVGIKFKAIESNLDLFEACRRVHSGNISALYRINEKVYVVVYSDKVIGIIGICEYFEMPKDSSNYFKGMSNLKKIDLRDVRDDETITLAGAFYGCDSLLSIDLRSFSNKKVENIAYLFYGCENVNTIYFTLDNDKFNSIISEKPLKRLEKNKGDEEKLENWLEIAGFLSGCENLENFIGDIPGLYNAFYGFFYNVFFKYNGFNDGFLVIPDEFYTELQKSKVVGSFRPATWEDPPEYPELELNPAADGPMVDSILEAIEYLLTEDEYFGNLVVLSSVSKLLEKKVLEKYIDSEKYIEFCNDSYRDDDYNIDDDSFFDDRKDRYWYDAGYPY